MDRQAKIAKIDALFKREKSPGEEGNLLTRGYCLSDMCEILHHAVKHLYDDSYINELLEDIDGNHYYWTFIGLSKFKTQQHIETPEELKPMLKLFLEDPSNPEPELDELAAECYPEIEYEWIDVFGANPPESEKK